MRINVIIPVRDKDTENVRFKRDFDTRGGHKVFENVTLLSPSGEEPPTHLIMSWGRCSRELVERIEAAFPGARVWRGEPVQGVTRLGLKFLKLQEEIDNPDPDMRGL